MFRIFLCLEVAFLVAAAAVYAGSGKAGAELERPALPDYPIVGVWRGEHPTPRFTYVQIYTFREDGTFRMELRTNRAEPVVSEGKYEYKNRSLTLKHAGEREPETMAIFWSGPDDFAPLPTGLLNMNYQRVK
jgi:hypothetical protein